MDYAVLPPEINSGRMYTGAGSGPMLAAAAAWDGLAGDLYSTTASYSSVISGLTGSWAGPSSAAMAAAAASHVEWLTSTAAQAERAAAQAKAAAAAYEAAFAATVPPPVIAANRATLSALVATNLLGQNTPAIAAVEAHYGEMWAQDAAAMYGYAGASATAARMTPFTAPRHTTNPGATESQTAAVAASPESHAQTIVASAQQSMSAVPSTLEGLAATWAPKTAPGLAGMLDAVMNGPTPPILVDVNMLGMGVGGTPAAVPSMWAISAISWATGATHAPAAAAPLPGPLEEPFEASALRPGARTAMSAGVGQAHTLGRLSVPPGWATAAPAMRLAAAADNADPALAAGAVNPADLFRPMPFFGGAPPTTMPSRGARGASQNRWRPPLLKLRARNRSQGKETQ